MSAALHRIQSPAEVANLRALAAEDNHVALYPTHLVRKDGETVGYLSLCAMPVVNVWLHSQKVKAVESVRLLSQVDGHFGITGLDSYIMPCDPRSPFFPNMGRLGFQPLGSTVLHVKNLKA